MHTAGVSWSVRKTFYTFLAACIAVAAPAPIFAGCVIKRVAELPITMDGLRPTIGVQFNGKPASLVLDSGAFFSSISGATAAEYGLKLRPAPFGLQVRGIGGYTDMSLATVKDFGLIGITLHNVDFLVGGSEVGGLLGQNLLKNFDVEYDLARGAVRLFKTDGCSKSVLAYWATPGQAYSVLHIDSIDSHDPHTTGDAYVNGKEIRVMFDTGADPSILSLQAAARAGVKLDSPGVVEAGFTRGLGRGNNKSYLARFDSFKIGDSEEIKNTRLRIGEIGLGGADMLLGADFFVSHRIFVSNHERKAFITYNGGPVFNLSTVSQAASATPANGQGAPGGSSASGAPDAAVAPGASRSANEDVNASDSPMDAAGYARRGAGFAARRDFVPALADLSKACELTPNEPEYFYRRALLYLQTGALPLALADLDHALKEKDDFLPAYLPRAEIHLQQKDMAAADADLDRLDRLAPQQADLRLELANIFARLEQFSAAIKQYDLWIDSHADDSRLSLALGGRCLVSALQNQGLEQGLKDCSKALRREDKKSPDYGALYANRGMVYLRQGNDDKAIADFNDALKAAPNNARALYGRGVAESRKNKPKESAADIAAAQAIAPQLQERYKRYGIEP
jgi:tetratricopeptide (TPR) repeat protein/predicted aspartyl protease